MRYEVLMGQVLSHTAEPARAEKYLLQARECIAGYPAILTEFDDAFITASQLWL